MWDTDSWDADSWDTDSWEGCAVVSSGGSGFTTITGLTVITVVVG